MLGKVGMVVGDAGTDGYVDNAMFHSDSPRLASRGFSRVES